MLTNTYRSSKHFSWKKGVPDCILIDPRWPWDRCTGKGDTAGREPIQTSNAGICEMRVCSNAAVMGVTVEGQIVEIIQR